MEQNQKRFIVIGADVHSTSYTLCAMERTIHGNVVLRTSDAIEPKVSLIIKFIKGVLKDFGIKREECDILVGYEAGCLGYSLYRDLTHKKYPCAILAPSTMTQTKGVSQKNDARDAKKIAMDLCNYTYQAVYVPDTMDEDTRDYIRAREDCCDALKVLKQQINAFVMRHGQAYDGTKWTNKHIDWLFALPLTDLAKETLQSYITRLLQMEETLATYDNRIHELATQTRYEDSVKRLGCFIGVREHTALALISEVGDFNRFESADKFAAFLGLVPKDNSSGDKTRLGGITKAGNSHLRKLLIESAGGICRGAVGYKSKDLKKRQGGNLPEVIDYADRANVRLRKRYHSMNKRMMKRNVAVTAVARELACFIWGMMTGHIQPRIQRRAS